MLDFTNTPERRRKAARERNRRALILLGFAALIPAAAMAIDVESLGALIRG